MVTVLPVTDVQQERNLLMHPGQGYHAFKISCGPDGIDDVGTLLEGGQWPVLWDIGKNH